MFFNPIIYNFICFKRPSLHLPKPIDKRLIMGNVYYILLYILLSHQINKTIITQMFAIAGIILISTAITAVYLEDKFKRPKL
jgi:hypothetical protein